MLFTFAPKEMRTEGWDSNPDKGPVNLPAMKRTTQPTRATRIITCQNTAEVTTVGANALPPISPRYSVYDVMNWAYGVVNWARVSLCVGFRFVDAAQEKRGKKKRTE